MNYLQAFRRSKYTLLFIIAVTISIVYLLFHPVSVPRDDPGFPPISGAAEIELADYLTQQGAKMYGAYWCPHCHEQAKLFGQEAWNKINYIECAQDAQKKPQPDVCKRAGIKGFPTWTINGELDPGVKKLARLAKITGYQGNTDFKYDRLFSR